MASNDLEEAVPLNDLAKVPTINVEFDETELPADVIFYPDSPTITLSQYANSEIEDDEQPCSWGPFKPYFCQIFREPKVVLFCLCWACIIQGMVVNGFIGIVVTTIERRFDLASTDVGIIASSYDVASVLCLIPVSYFGGYGRKPLWLGNGLFLIGAGSFLFAMPHFMTDLYQYENEDLPSDICSVSSLVSNVTMQSLCVAESAPINSFKSFKYIFILAQLLHGAGSTPLYTLGITYMNDNLDDKSSPVYIGIFYAMAVVGPAVGYLLGGEFLKWYTDFGWVDLSKIDITPESSQWVGAWWLGFILAAMMAVIVAVPLLGFPKSLPGSAKIKAEKICEAYKGAEQRNPNQGFTGIFSSIKLLLMNPTFICLNFAGASEGMLISGFTAFIPKFVESQFSLSAGWAAQLVGFVSIPSGGGGALLGSYLVQKYDLRCASKIKMCLCTTFISLLLSMVFLVQCANLPFAGINADYESEISFVSTPYLNHSCNFQCDCTARRFNPVCGVDGIMYLSACHAGCLEEKSHNNKKLFSECGCVNEPVLIGDTHKTAIEGKCVSNCQYLALFLPAFGLVMMCTFATAVPALEATLKCVPAELASFALGIQWILVRCLGTIPAPILFGVLIDRSCKLWQKTCNDEGSCWFYDNATMGQNLLLLAILCKGLSTTFFFLSYFLYRPPAVITRLPSCPGDLISNNSMMQMLPNLKKCPVGNLYGQTLGTHHNPIA